MRYYQPEEIGSDVPMLELTRRNLETLLAKLDDSNSVRMLIAPGGEIMVRAVEDEVHYKTRLPGVTYTNGKFS